MPRIQVYDRHVNAREAATRALQAMAAASAAPAAYGPEYQHTTVPFGDREAVLERFQQQMPQVAMPVSRVDRALTSGLGASKTGSVSALPGFTTFSFPGGGSPQSYTSPQRPYLPEFASQDRQSYPVHRSLGNIYWRMFYKLDSVIGTGIDMKADLVYGPFEATGEGVDGEIKDAMMASVEKTQLFAKLPYFERERDITGEVIPHLIWDDTQGMWTHLALHNPDHIEVIYTPLFNMAPILRYRPDERLQQVLSAPYASAQALRSSMPPELLHAVTSGQPIELDPLCVSFLPRKQHMYDVRGTSVISRLWRALMLEDALWDATISTARRAAAPVKIAKLGNHVQGYIVSPEQEKRFIDSITQLEMDPQGWLVWNDALAIEYAGNQDRLMNISQYWDMFERIKLIALGINKGFLIGETTYAAAASGITVFLQRAKAARDRTESEWLIPKFFRPLAEMNAWIKPTPAEVGERGKPNVAPMIRTRRAPWQAQDRYIVPTLQWQNRLDPSIDSAQLQAVTALAGLGVKFSKQYLVSLVHGDWEEELHQAIVETEAEQKLIAQNPALMQQLQPPTESGAGGGPSILPGMPSLPGGGESGSSSDFGGELGPGPGPELGPPPGEVPPSAPGTEALPPGGAGAPGHGVIPGIPKEFGFGQLLSMFRGQEPDAEPWTDALETRAVARAFASQDPTALWDAVEDYLLDQGAPNSSIASLKQALDLQGVFGRREAALMKLVGRLPSDRDVNAWVGAPT